MANNLNGAVDPKILATMRHALGHETSGVVAGIMQRTGCSKEKAIDCVMHWVSRGVVRLLLQPNGECLIDFTMSQEEATEVIVDAEVGVINKGQTRLERPPLELLSGRTVSDPRARGRRLN